MSSTKATVSPAMVKLKEGQIENGVAVRSVTWQSVAKQANHVLGRGAQLVPIHSPNRAYDDDGDFSFRVKPRAQAVQLCWVVGVISAEAQAEFGEPAESVKISAPAGTGDVQTFGISDRVDSMRVLLYYEDLSAQSDNETTKTIRIEFDGDAANSGGKVMCLGCWEVPRPEISATSATDMGIAVDSLQVEDPIWSDNSATPEGAYRIADAVDDASDIGRRVGHFSYATVTDAALSISGSSFATVFALDPTALARALDLDSSTKKAGESATLNVEVLGRSHPASAVPWRWEVETTDDADPSTTNLSNTTFDWSSRLITVDTEDLAASDGRRDSTWFFFRVRALRAQIIGINVFES